MLRKMQKILMKILLKKLAYNLILNKLGINN